MLDGLTGWVTDVVDSLGYLGVAFLVALESVFPPIRSEVVLPLAGFVAGRGDASVPGMVGSLVWKSALIGAGAVLGDRWTEVGDVVGLLQAVVVILVVVALGRFAWTRVLRPRLQGAGHLPPDDG
jgi:membrane protein DedA with SNARE-associated domain